MAHCVNCGTELGAGIKFCPACGTMQPAEQPVQQPVQEPVQQTYQQPVQQTYQQQTYQQPQYEQPVYQQPVQQPVRPASPDDKYRYLAALSYLSLVVLVVFAIFAGKDSNYFRRHANQVAALYIWELACAVLFIIPILGWIVGGIGMVCGFIFMIIAAVKALKCVEYQIPIFGKFQIIPQV